MLPLIFLVIGVLAQQTFAEEPEAIVGGERAVPGEFPYQVSLRYNGLHMCGGSIIKNDTILTAAHCVDGIAKPPYRNYKVATGSISLFKGELYTVKEVIVHEGFSNRVEDAWKNDIALIKLAKPIQSTKYQSPIELTNSKPVPGQQCTLSGWGQISTHGPLPLRLLKMNQTVVAQSECQKRFYDMPLTGSHLCTLNQRGIGACSGDSGGPLVSNGKQVGITSWVMPCAKGEPDVYTDVYYHLPWIKNNA